MKKFLRAIVGLVYIMPNINYIIENIQTVDMSHTFMVLFQSIMSIGIVILLVNYND